MKKDKAITIIAMVVHILLLVIVGVMLVTVLEILSFSISNDAEIEWNIFVAVMCFGSLILIFHIIDFVEKWGNKLKEYIKIIQS